MGHFEHDADGLHIAFDFDQVGTGPPVVLAHALAFASWYDPLIAALDGWSVLRYRRTIAGDPQAFSIDADAAALAALIDHVGFERPHVVGHSYGGLVALAVVRADAVRVRLARPARAGADRVPPAGARIGRDGTAVQASTARGPAVAMHEFLQLVCGDDGVTALDAAVPGAVAAAEAAAAQFFDAELPAVAAWDVDTSLLARIEVPVLNVVGAASSPRFVDGAEAIQRWLPQAAAPRRARRRPPADGGGVARRRQPARSLLAGCRLTAFVMVRQRVFMPVADGSRMALGARNGGEW